MPKVLVADKINEKGVEVLEGSAEIVNNPKITPEELLETIDQYDAIIVRSRTKMTKEDNSFHQKLSLRTLKRRREKIF